MTEMSLRGREWPEGCARATGPGAWLLRRLAQRLSCGRLVIVLPNGTRIEHRAPEAGPEATLMLHRWRTLRRLLFGGDVGFGEAYVDGDWSSPDTAALIELMARNQSGFAKVERGSLPIRLMNRLLHLARRNTRDGSRRNIMEHYDLGNDFYARWLDRGMNYSSAVYRDSETTLEAAQAAKQDRVLKLLDVAAGASVLEIGCGWGGLARRLAERDARVTALTLSPAQADYAKIHLADAGVAKHVDVRLEDYRDVGGQFDRIVSIEMLEAVGEAFWPGYFTTLRDRLLPGGLAVLQVITIADERFATYRRGTDFIQRHVFPGGMLPSPGAMRRLVDGAGLALEAVETFGLSYARTLSEWRARFHAAWPEIAALGFPPRFRRLWDYYLAYCEAGFRAGAIDVGLWRLRRPS